jgi:hypothetical protein
MHRLFLTLLLTGGFLEFFKPLLNPASSATPVTPQNHSVGGSLDRTKDGCDFGIRSQKLLPLGWISSNIYGCLLVGKNQSQCSGGMHFLKNCF